jgi:uncharacterized RDD family membrane protein YckC
MNTERLDTRQAVELAEGVIIHLRTAGPLPRAGAYLLDLLIRVVILGISGIVLLFAGVALGGKVAQGLMLLAWFLLDWFYPVVFEAGKRGATPGKRAAGLRVVQTSGAPITLGQAVVRNFLRFIDAMPVFLYGFGVVSCLATKRFQRLGDLAAGTVVVYDRSPAPMVSQLPPPIERMRPPLPLTPEEIRSLAMFQERAGLWSENRRVELADKVSCLTSASGPEGVRRLLAMAQTLRGGDQ